MFLHYIICKLKEHKKDKFHKMKGSNQSFSKLHLNGQWCVLRPPCCASSVTFHRGHRGSRSSGSRAGWTGCISVQRLLCPDGHGQGNSPQKGSKLILQRNLLWLELHGKTRLPDWKTAGSAKAGQGASAGFNMEMCLWAELDGCVRREGEVGQRDRKRKGKREIGRQSLARLIRLRL